jgi:hypothetical protein
MMNGTIGEWPMGEKSVIWFEPSNKYIVAEPPVAKVIRQITQKGNEDHDVGFLKKEYGLTQELADAFARDVEAFLRDNLKPHVHSSFMLSDIQADQPFLRRYYSINGVTFLAEYATEEAEELIHPKFGHHEVLSIPEPMHHFQVLQGKGGYALIVDGEMIGSWAYAENHFLSGKFSMQLLQKITESNEDDWMAVLHAAGVSNGQRCLIFFGNSGNGKSTLSAILMANGLNVLADDFLPMAQQTGLVCPFPAAISIKTKAYGLLSNHFPELGKLPEISNSSGKTFRYLPNKQQMHPVPCVGLVFTKYVKGSGFLFEPLAPDEAFAHLVPDSWISPKAENADRFVKWFSGLPCYKLTYSDNERMVQTIISMLNHDA